MPYLDLDLMNFGDPQSNVKKNSFKITYYVGSIRIRKKRKLVYWRSSNGSGAIKVLQDDVACNTSVATFPLHFKFDTPGK